VEAFVTTIGAAALAARRGWVGEAEEPTGQCDVVGPVGVGEEAVVTDAPRCDNYGDVMEIG
jgi:hypothetical protein